MSSSLASFMGDLQEDLVFEQVKQQLQEGVSPESIFNELQAGMTIVGERYQSQDYYLSELIMAADIFKNATALLQEKLQTVSKETIGTIVLGTVAGDIHDIGKDIVSLVFASNGFQVIDLGVDVPIPRFVEAVRTHQPDFVGISCLLTTCFDKMRATIAALEEEGLRSSVKVLIGGGPVEQATCDYVKADALCKDAPSGVKIAKQVLGVE
ncbi:cobalamin B12-binding domain-containing protein [Candidatus Formimonas warabiya]|uniref:Cobalamin-binding protein n=1 Tax=Formimonas warabiya TaxID=1761012 RepID=A0A3G1KS55_FORW1|nr:cobalamin-dependent protein [Candidatus Formimonas warabiya]ATW25224.1 cobalamin-binding protein [Candidatus Formimonas warabiya]